MNQYHGEDNNEQQLQQQARKKPRKAQYPRSSFFLGNSSVYDTTLVNRIPLDKNGLVQLTSSMSLRQVGYNARFLLREDYTDKLITQSADQIQQIEDIVKPYGPILVELYFKYVDPFYPVLQRKLFLEKYDRGYQEVNPSLLSAIYLVAIELWDSDSRLIDRPKPDQAALYEVAHQAFYNVLNRPKLTAIQAGLILLQCSKNYPLNENGSNRKWILCSQVVALVEDLGLGLDCSGWKLPKWEKGLRKRLAWAAFFQDKWISLVESRPSHLLPSINWIVADLTVDDFVEKASSSVHSMNSNIDINLNNPKTNNDLENGKIFFIELVKLSKILSEILHAFYSLAGIQEQQTIKIVLELAKPIQLKLRSWKLSLPEILKNDFIIKINTGSESSASITSSNNGNGRLPNCNSYLNLAYFITEITLHRKIITSLTVDEIPDLVAVCRNAAKSRLNAAVEFLMSLKSENIHSFWYSTTSSDFALIGTFAMILLSTEIDPMEASVIKDVLFNFRWCLKIISKSFYHAHQGLRQFSSLYAKIPEFENQAMEISSRSGSATSIPQHYQQNNPQFFQKMLQQQQQQQQQEQQQPQVQSLSPFSVQSFEQSPTNQWPMMSIQNPSSQNQQQQQQQQQQQSQQQSPMDFTIPQEGFDIGVPDMSPNMKSFLQQ